MNLGHAIRNKGLEAPNLVLDILQGRHRVRPEKRFHLLADRAPSELSYLAVPLTLSPAVLGEVWSTL